MDSTKNAQKQQFGESSEEPGRVESSISLSCSSPTKETCLNDSFIENTSITSTTIQSIDLPNLDENGHLNWSEQKQQLTKLLSKGKCCSELFKLNKQILTLNISKNGLRSFDCCILPLENCFEIDASQNELVQLLQFLPLTQTLLKLNLADNRINSISCLNNFVNIQWINFSHNRIESLPLLDNLHYLSTLILNCNRLRAIPNLSKLEVLTELGLHGNLIRSFEHIHSLIPSTIRILDLGGNLVSDLCQVSFLRGFTYLESLTLLGNSFCSSNGYKFSYRPFVYSCVLNELKILDGVCLSEGEVIKGEWLHSYGKTRCFLPGSHLQLCSFLSIECPLVSIEMPIVGGGDEERLKKVIQKRREYNQNLQHYYSTPSLLLLEKSQASTTTTSPLNPSGSLTPTPRGRGTIINKNINFSENEKNGTKNWRINTITQSEGKHLAKNNTTTIYTPTSISAAGVNATETTPKTSKNKEEEIKRLEDENNVSTTTLTEITTVHPSKNLSKFGILRSATIHSPTPTTSRLTTSSKVCQIVRNATFTHPTPPPILKNTKIPILGKTAEKKKSKGSGGCFRSVLTQKLRRRSNTCNTAPSSTTKLNDQTRIQLLQKRIDKLDEQNAELLNIGEDNVKTLQQMADKLKEVENVLSDQINQNKKLQDLLLPTPINLKQQQVEGTNNILITWENTLPILNSINHYEVFVNDQQMGKVVARNKRLMITDINSFDDLRVSIQARFSQLNNAHSKRAEITLKKEGEDEEESATVRMALYFVALKLLFF